MTNFCQLEEILIPIPWTEIQEFKEGFRIDSKLKAYESNNLRNYLQELATSLLQPASTNR